MKNSTTLTEGSTRGEAGGVAVGESGGTAEHVAPTAREERPDRLSESVAITIKSSTGYDDSETFTLRGKRATNAFARRLMTVALRAYDKRDDDAGE